MLVYQNKNQCQPTVKENTAPNLSGKVETGWREKELFFPSEKATKKSHVGSGVRLMIALSEAEPGLNYTVKWNVNRSTGEVKTKQFGLVPGVELFLLNSGFGGVMVCIRGKRVAIDKETAMRIKV